VSLADLSGSGLGRGRIRTLESLGQARELAGYQDEPRQMRSAVVGKSGALHLGFERRGARTALVRMERQVPLLVQRPLYWDRSVPGMACVTIIHTSGGVLQGDRAYVRIAVAAGAQAHVTTQAATKIHEMDANYAAQLQDITLDHGGYLEYLPGVTIPHRHARYLADTLVTLPDDATMLLSEVVMPGRKHHRDGELFQYDVFSSTVSAERPDGRPLFTEKILVEPAAWSVREPGAMGGYDVLGTVFALTGREHAGRILERSEPVFDAGIDVVSGAALLPNDAGVVLRVLGRESVPVRRRIRQFWGVVRQQVLGVPVPDAFLWE
jgi:urease accessory protein